MFLKYHVELPVQIDLVSVSLELIVNCSQEALLDNEFLNVVNFATKVSNTLMQPLFSGVSSLLINFWY